MIILKIVIILYLMHLLATSEHKGFIYPKFITSVKDLGAHFKVAKITNSLYFQPIDNKWRKKKCKSLGLKFKESILYDTNIERRKLTLSTFPYDLYKVEKLNSLYKSLAYVICGNEKLYAKIQRKVFVTIKNSKKFKKYMNGKLDLYLNGLGNVSKKGGVRSSRCPSHESPLI
ncbi:uncharacterized protein LOC126909833 isoform X2 [Daktulosphaira vitifoliae]|uniref:uncharacterized protein LOC126909833 isoform X2 n=1 Tax=Daktulosphaira vitifoliae TaxID=58002 RepID=UPI0021A9DEB3|nr:uncharacterized protein LOC126909833 isoform X2 [Daktulosphaira vitifoliae]